MIAARVPCYRPFENLAYAHLAAIGVLGIEIRAPTAAAAPGESLRVASFGLRATTVQGSLDLTRADTAEQVAEVASVLRALDCPLLFVALRPIDLPHAMLGERLRHAGESAANQGITISLETHPDLAGNADQALRTLDAVAHPAVRLNFDTANIHFYNHGLNCVAELRRCLPYVASVHLKDTDGRFGERAFPALGDGNVDFAAVFELLDEIGFDGPCTMEPDGIDGETRTPELILQRMTRSAAYLRGLGRL